MLTAHLPSGFLLLKSLRMKMADTPWLAPAALLGAVLPDADIFFFYFVDDRAIHHHKYWVHVPAFWAAIAVVVLPFVAILKRETLVLVSVFFLAITMHLLLDSISGGIMWAWPFDDTLYALTEVPASHSHWILSFVFHWTFLFELAIWGTAALLAFRGVRR